MSGVHQLTSARSDLRASAVRLLDVLERAVAIREESLAAAAALRGAVDGYSSARLEFAVHEEAEGCAHDVETQEIPLDEQRDEVRALLQLIELAERAAA